MDPYERADITSNTYWDWYMSKGYMIMAAQAVVQPFLITFKDYPPRQKAASFTLDQALEKMPATFNSGRCPRSPRLPVPRFTRTPISPGGEPEIMTPGCVQDRIGTLTTVDGLNRRSA